MQPINPNNNSLFQSIFEALEDRVLFDGVPDATFVLPEAGVDMPVPAQVQSLQSVDSQTPRELVIIDGSVQDADVLLQGILESKPDSLLEIHILDSDSDGVQQITDLLSASESKYDAIHILSHGNEGTVSLGNSTLTSENAAEYADQLASWADALTDDADLLFYGCDLAGNESGHDLINYVSAVTGTDVAASDDLTGAEELGGDWELEVNVGTVETAAVTASAFDSTLADKDGDGVDDEFDLDDDNDGILDVDEGFVPTLTAPINTTGLNTPGFPLNTDVSSGNTAQLNGLFSGLLDFEAELVSANSGGGGGFQSNGDLNVTFFNEFQFAFGFGLQNTTNQPITNWAVEITNANYTFNQSQFTNNTAFNLVTTTNPDGTFNHLFVGTSTIPPFGSIPGGNIAINGINFGFPPNSSGITTGTAGGAGGGGGGGTAPSFAGGVQVQNDPTLGGDFIFVQPQGLGNFPTDFAEYTFNFNNPVQNLSFVTSGINFGDTVVYEAFFQGVPVPITAANFSGFTDGVVNQNGNELFNAAGVGGTNVDDNLGILTISQPIDQIIARAGKGNGSDSTVSLGFTAFGGDIILGPETSTDDDGDGIPNHCDLDSDNDGISDLEESGQDPSLVDLNGDGVVDGGVDANGVPLAANGGVRPVDTDTDGIQDFLDLDSDNDAIPDAVEAQPTATYTPPTGVDSDGDGIDDAFDSTVGHGGNFTPTEDTDGDGAPDYLDRDSDGDGLNDLVESGLNPGADNTATVSQTTLRPIVTKTPMESSPIRSTTWTTST